MRKSAGSPRATEGAAKEISETLLVTGVCLDCLNEIMCSELPLDLTYFSVYRRGLRFGDVKLCAHVHKS
jgi:hypothetical protein